MFTRHSHNAKAGHQLETDIDLGGAQVLRIATFKAMGGSLVTRGTVHRVGGGFMQHMLHQDFSRRLLTSLPKRVSKKVVTAQHDEVLTKIDEVKLAIELHYQQLEQAKVGKEACECMISKLPPAA